MRKWGIAVIAALLMLVGGAAYAEDRPTDGGSSAPGSEPGIEPIATGSIDVERITLSVDGKTVEAAPPAQAVKVVLTLRNNLETTAKNVRVRADQPPQGMRITDADATVGDIAAGASDTATIGVVVDKDGCTDFVGFGGEITYEGGTAPLKVGFAVACPGPRLSLENVIFTGGDGDGVPEPGETVRATIVLRNDGRDPASGVRARITITSDKVSTQNDALAWADLDPQESARSASPLTLVVADDAPRQKSCEGVSILPVPDVVAKDQGSLPPDTAVSSDGTFSSPAANASDLPASSEPGYAGGGAPGSTGTVEPEPAPATVEPVPAPGTIEPQPEPEPADQPAEITMKLTVTASDYQTTLEYSNQIFCALEGRGVADKGVPAASAAHDDASGSNGGGVALPLLVAALASGVAVGGRFLLAR